MSAQPISPTQSPEPTPDAQRPVVFEPMHVEDLDEIAATERTLYTYPWTRGNFADSLKAGYSGWVLRQSGMHAGEAGALIGYFIVMIAVDEGHLLNISVAKAWQHQGYGLMLLNEAVLIARRYRATSMILEVRPTNTRAMSIYERYGLRRVGIRHGYYPFSETDQTQREDAIVMKLEMV